MRKKRSRNTYARSSYKYNVFRNETDACYNEFKEILILLKQSLYDLLCDISCKCTS